MSVSAAGVRDSRTATYVPALGHLQTRGKTAQPDTVLLVPDDFEVLDGVAVGDIEWEPPVVRTPSTPLPIRVVSLVEPSHGHPGLGFEAKPCTVPGRQGGGGV